MRTFKPRRGRITTAQSAALERLWPQWGFEIPETADAPLARAELFGRSAPLVLEIGCGMGDAVIAMATAAPECDFLAVDVHTPGLGNVLFQAIGARDYPLMSGAFLLITVAIVLANIVADLLYTVIDPRVRR